MSKLPEKYIQVEGDDNLVRDKESNAILNINLQAFENYKRKLDHERRVDESLNDIENLKDEMNDVKNMLKLILQKLQ